MNDKIECHVYNALDIIYVFRNSVHCLDDQDQEKTIVAIEQNGISTYQNNSFLSLIQSHGARVLLTLSDRALESCARFGRMSILDNIPDFFECTNTTFAVRFENVPLIIDLEFLVNTDIHVCCYLFNRDTASLEFTLYRSQLKTKIHRLYPQTERQLFEFFGIHDVGRFLLRFVDTINIRHHMLFSVLIDDAKKITVSKKNIPLRCLMMLACGLSYYEQVGYLARDYTVDDMYNKRNILNRTRKMSLCDFLGEPLASRIITAAGMRISPVNILVMHFAQLILDRIFTEDHNIPTEFIEYTLRVQYGPSSLPCNFVKEYTGLTMRHPTKKTYATRSFDISPFIHLDVQYF
jgi:hypothetical protein